MPSTVQITFPNDAVSFDGNTAFINGSLAITYNNDGSLANISGNLTVTDANGNETYGPFFGSLNARNNVYSLSAYGQTDDVHDSINFSYQGEQPTSITNISISKGGVGYIYNGNDTVVAAPVCFLAGTRITTARGLIEVEDLLVGDVVLTSSDKRRPIRWLGHRALDCRKHPRTHEVMPIRIAAHAFAENKPVRDLILSPGHPVLVGADEAGNGGYLVPIMCLINGTTIERVAMEEVIYWHVELDQHDILLAEALPAESYFDLGSRPWFDGAEGVLYDPDMALPGRPGRCRPVAVDGPVVEAEQRRLDAVFAMRLAGACAWPTEDASTFSDLNAV